jgi:hypothetical protein
MVRTFGGRRRRSFALLALATAGATAGLSLTSPGSAYATSRTWLDGSGNWSVGVDWTGHVIPGGDDVSIVNSDGVPRTVTLDVNSATLTSFTIDLTGAGSGANTLSIATTTLAVSGPEWIGFTGRGGVNQTGGLNTMTGPLLLGIGNTSNGNYTLSNTATLSADGESIGLSGSGTLTQSGSSLNQITDFLALDEPSSVYNLNGGYLYVEGAGSTQAEVLNAGTFNQNGGYHQVGDGTNVYSLQIGANAAKSGATYNLQDPSAQLDVYGNAYVGGTSSAAAAPGVWKISSGVAYVSGTVKVWNNSGTQLNLNGGTLEAGALDFSDGGGAAVNKFNWTSGTLSIQGSSGFTLGSASFPINQTIGSTQKLDVTKTLTISSASSLTLSGGSLSAGALVLQNSPSQFTWSSGTISLGQVSVDSVDPAPLGSTLTLGADKTLLTNFEYIGSTGTGSVIQNGGSSSSANLFIGDGTMSVGSYLLTGSSSTLHIVNSEYVGMSGTGTVSNGVITTYGGSFTQSDGTQTIQDFLYLGESTGGTGHYSLTGGTLETDRTQYIGWGGVAVFLQSGGANTSNQGMVVGYGGNSGSGSYALSGGTLIVLRGDEEIGYGATGVFTQTGGTSVVGSSTLSAAMDIAYQAGSTGTYTLNNSNAPASLSVFGNVYVGGSTFGVGGAGTLNMSSGTATITGALTIYNTPGTQVNLNGGTLTVGSLDFSDGANAAASRFHWTAGTLEVKNEAFVGAGALENPVLASGQNLIADGGEAVESTGDSITLSGGTNTVSGDLTIGAGEPFSGALPTYTVNNPSSSLTVDHYLIVGNGCAGIMNLSSGAVTVTSTLAVFDGPGPNGVSQLNVSGGTLTVGNFHVFTNLAGAGGNADFHWTGGTVKIVGAGSESEDYLPADSVNSGCSLVLAPTGQNMLCLPLLDNGANALPNDGSITLDSPSAAYDVTLLGAVTNNSDGSIFYRAGAGGARGITFLTNSGTISGSDGAAATLSVTSLTLNAGVLSFDLGADTAHSDQIDVNATLNLAGLAGATSISLTNLGSMQLGIYALIDYGTFNGNLNNLIVGNAPANFSYRLQDDPANHSIDLVIGTPGTPGVWLGGPGNWSDSTKWGTGAVPGDSSFHVRIDNGNPTVSNVSLDLDETVGDIQVNVQDSLSINSGHTLTIVGSATSVFAGALSNAGTLAISAGTTRFFGGGSDSGTFSVASGATLEFRGGTHTMNPGAALTGSGTVSLIGGTVAFSGALDMAASSPSLSISGGMLSVGTDENVADGASQSVNQSGGTHTVGGNMIVGRNNGSNGSYTISQGSLSVTGFLGLAEFGTTPIGNFTQTGGSVSVGSFLEVAGFGTGSYSISGGTIQALDLYVGTLAGATGTLALSGTGNVNVRNVYISRDLNSHGTVNQTGGTLIATGSEQIGASGSVNISAGSLSAASLNNSGMFADSSTLTIGAVTNSGTFSQTGTLTESGNLTNSGTATLGGTQNWSAGTILTNTAGITTIQSDAGSATSSPLGVQITGGSVALASPQHWAALVVSGNGVLDIANNHIFINYGSGPDPIASIAVYLATGYAGGAWNGPGIVSSTAAVTPGYSLGYADSADPGNPAGLASGTIEIKYTLLGDADLSGTVNGVDFGILAANFNKGVTRWDQADFNYDNAVNGVDFGYLAANFNKGASGAADGPSALSDPALVAFAQANGLMADVPEPTELSLLAIGSAFIMRRRRVNQQ